MFCDRMGGATRSIFLVCNFFKKKISKNFRFSSTVKEYLTLGSLFAIFEPWIWRRLGPVPACIFKVDLNQMLLIRQSIEVDAEIACDLGVSLY